MAVISEYMAKKILELALNENPDDAYYSMFRGRKELIEAVTNRVLLRIGNQSK